MPPFSWWQLIPPCSDGSFLEILRTIFPRGEDIRLGDERARMSLRYPSLHSQTTGLTVPVVSPISGLIRSSSLTTAVYAVPTLNVLVRTIGLSSVPSSLICTRPVLLPKPLITWEAAITLSWKRSPGWGRTTVTPVCTSPWASVRLPTRTPGTSVIRFLVHGGSPDFQPFLFLQSHLLPFPFSFGSSFSLCASGHTPSTGIRSAR
jgi:hypothetical protein